MRKNDVTPSNMDNGKDDIIKHVQLTSRNFPPSELLQNRTGFTLIRLNEKICTKLLQMAK